jgi:hypothetical protein
LTSTMGTPSRHSRSARARTSSGVSAPPKPIEEGRQRNRLAGLFESEGEDVAVVEHEDSVRRPFGGRPAEADHPEPKPEAERLPFARLRATCGNEGAAGRRDRGCRRSRGLILVDTMRPRIQSGLRARRETLTSRRGRSRYRPSDAGRSVRIVPSDGFGSLLRQTQGPGGLQ